MNQYQTRSLYARLHMRNYESREHEDFLQARLDSGYTLDAPEQIPLGYCFQGKTHAKGEPIMATTTRG